MDGRVLLEQIHAIRQKCAGVAARVVCLGAAVIAMSGCIAEDKRPEPIAETPAAQSRPVPETAAPPSPVKKDDVPEAEPQPLTGSGQAIWAEGFAGQMVQGLDGGLYPSYHAATIRRVQSLLKERNVYSGPINGVLDRPTMDSIYAFQEATHALQRCGVPTPNTRKLLEQGSHTDVA